VRYYKQRPTSGVMDAKPNGGLDTRKALGKMTDDDEGWEWTVYPEEPRYYPYPVPQRFKTEQEFRRALEEFNSIRWHITDPKELKSFIDELVENHWPPE